MDDEVGEARLGPQRWQRLGAVYTVMSYPGMGRGLEGGERPRGDQKPWVRLLVLKCTVVHHTCFLNLHFLI